MTVLDNFKFLFTIKALLGMMFMLSIFVSASCEAPNAITETTDKMISVDLVSNIYKNIRGRKCVDDIDNENDVASPTLSPTSSPSKPPALSPTSSPTKPPVEDYYEDNNDDDNDDENEEDENEVLSPTVSPTSGPTKSLTLPPTSSPTKSLTLPPTSSPTKSPVDDYYDENNEDGSDDENGEDENETLSPTLSPTSSPTKSPVVLDITGETAICPSTNEDPLQLSFDGKITIEIVSFDTLCTLSMNIKNDQETWIPLGRSYDNHDWESVAGPYQIDFECDGIMCASTVELPTLTNGEEFWFQLTTFSISERNNLKSQDIAARFLEQTTFGSTRNELLQWKDLGIASTSSLDYSFSEWIHEQINDIPMTSHRQVFRKNSATRAKTITDIGLPTHPCDPNTRWHSYALNHLDWRYHIEGEEEEVYGKVTFEEIEKSKGSNEEAVYTLFFDGIPRTEITNLTYWDWESDQSIELDINLEYEIGHIDEYEHGFFELYLIDSSSGEEYFFDMEIGSPKIQFSNIDLYPQLSSRVIALSPQDKNSMFSPLPGTYFEEEFLLADGLDHPICDTLNEGSYPVFIDFSDGDFLLFDPRLSIRDNTIEQPLSDGGGGHKALGSVCSNVPRSFLNEEFCYLSDETACRDNYLVPDAQIHLSRDTLSTFHELTGRYVYAVEGLIAENSPCIEASLSKWENIGSSLGCDVTSFEDNTAKTLRQYLKWWYRGDNTDEIRSFEFWNEEEQSDCDIDATTPSITKDIIINADFVCWKLVHPDHHKVYDFSYWVNEHPGGQAAIQQFAEDESFILKYPHGDEMWRWEYNQDYFWHFGELDGYTNLRWISEELQTIEVSEELVGEHAAVTTGVVVCGSPNEVSNDHTLGETGISLYTGWGKSDIEPHEAEMQKQSIWVKTVLNGNDQLRQRMAWALSQMFAIDPSQNDHELGEAFMTYYDIFVRHAFGNFFNILKEVSYSTLMAEMLTFIRSKSSAYVWKHEGVITFADENFAREIMQLFTIGTILMRMNGTPILDKDTNEPILTYTNEHIVSFARAWTGFNAHGRRGNVEMPAWLNRIDPMYIEAEWRDVFPKIDLLGGFIGDAFPLCTDLPEKAFLRKGASYRLLGSLSDLTLSRNPEDWENNFMKPFKALRLEKSSALYMELCGSSDNENCNFKGHFTLDKNLACDGKECLVDSVRLIEINEGIYFEYIRQPCVELSYFGNAQTITSQWRDRNMCADPLTIVASEACCASNDDWWYVDEKNCQYADERVTFESAVKRCEDINKSICPFEYVEDMTECYSSSFHWHGSSCTLKAKIQDETGYIAIVHEVPDTSDESIVQLINSDSRNFFPVYWDSDFPNLSNNCGDGICKQIHESCICDILVEEQSVFQSLPSSADIVISSLFVGSFSPDVFNMDHYMSTKNVPGMKVFFRSDESYDIDTIFEVQSNGEKKYYKNIKSTVYLTDGNGNKSTFSFRNPPHFMNFADPDERDAHYETEAVLKHYFHHPNVPPFIAIFLIQRFGISNPSPRYVEQVATAFKDGFYEYSGHSSPTVSYGTGEYGDLSATLTAVILDQESRSIILDSDPTKGSLKEPLLKVINYMRSMEYIPAEYHRSSRENTALVDMTKKIGQMVYDNKTIFSFFRREFTPFGPVQQASLVAPEAQKYMAPNVIGLLNGIFSLTKYGLRECYAGFGARSHRGRCEQEGHFESSFGRLGYIPEDPSNSHEVVDELSTLLTSGRLNSKSRDILIESYENTKDIASALLLAQQLISVSPEFHSTNLVQFNGEAIPKPDPIEPSTLPYKAVVFVNLEGGSDSYNFLVPHSQCSVKDMYAEYAEQRGSVALSKSSLHKIDTGGQSQVCDKFGIHPDLPVLNTLYSDNDLSFFANVGILFEPVDKSDWEYKTPTQLFAHDIQQQDIQRIDPKNAAHGTGFLGRMADILTLQGHNTGSFSVNSNEQIVLNGEPQKSPSVTSVSPEGIAEFNDQPSSEDMRELMFDLNNITTSSSSIYGKTWSHMFDEFVHKYENLRGTLGDVDYREQYPESWLGEQLAMVSSLMQMREPLGHDRHFFYVESGGWDTHLNQPQADVELIPELNNGLESFANATKAQGLWNDVLVIVASEFGRTFMANSGYGTDHGWGGNYFLFGGAVKGGKIFGQYPNDLTEAGPLNLGRGRFIPTTSWDSIYNAVAGWIGVSSNDDFDKILPNRGKFDLYTKNEIFN